MRQRVQQPVRGRSAAMQRAEALTKRAPVGGLVAELGTMRGPMADCALSLRPDLQWVMVDNWLPMDRQPQRYIDTQDDNALKDTVRCQADRNAAYQVAATNHISVVSMSTAQASTLFKCGTFDLVFIDADHSYEGVKEDIVLWRGLVKEGGWLGGHDYLNIDPRFEGVNRAVDELFPDGVETDLNYTWWIQL